jgi:hypothetical protein
MPAQVLDYSLANLKIPGLLGYSPPFGEKKADGAGLTTTEIVRNEMMPFMKQRSISGVPDTVGGDPPTGVISVDSIAMPIEFDANFSVAGGIELQLDDPSFEGQRVRIVASFETDASSNIILGVSGEPVSVTLGGGETLLLFAVNGKWTRFESGSGVDETVLAGIQNNISELQTGVGELQTDLSALETGITGLETSVGEAHGNIGVLKDFRQWSAVRLYAALDPAFYDGKPYYANPEDPPAVGQSPEQYPEKWKLAGMDEAVIGELRALIARIKARNDALWAEIFGEGGLLDGSAIKFDTLDGVMVERGVWNEPLARLEC